MAWHLLHPVAVHFPIALLLLALVGEAFSLVLKDEKWSWLVPAAEWVLWLGSIAACATAGLGWLAEETAPHIPAAWEVLEEHENLGWWTAGLFTALSLVRFVFRKDWRTMDRKKRWGFVAAWALCAGVLLAAAYHGGELVYRLGVGVAAAGQ